MFFKVTAWLMSHLPNMKGAGAGLLIYNRSQPPVGNLDVLVSSFLGFFLWEAHVIHLMSHQMAQTAELSRGAEVQSCEGDKFPPLLPHLIIYFLQRLKQRSLPGEANGRRVISSSQQ